MTVFTIPRGQARALLSSLLPHAGKHTDDTPHYGRIRCVPGADQLLAWTVDGVTAAAARVDMIDHLDAELDLFDLPVGAAKAILAVFRGPSNPDARQMWANAPLRVTLRESDVVLEEVDDDIIDIEGRALTVERWVTDGEDHYPDVPRMLARATEGPDANATCLVSPDAIARFIPSAKAWDEGLLLTTTTDPHRVEVRVGARLLGICPAIARDADARERTARSARDWITRLTPHVRPDRPTDVDDAVAAFRDALEAAGGGAVELLTGEHTEQPPAVAPDALTDDPDAEDGDDDA